MLVDRITRAKSAMTEAHLVSLFMGKIVRCSRRGQSRLTQSLNGAVAFTTRIPLGAQSNPFASKVRGHKFSFPLFFGYQALPP